MKLLYLCGPVTEIEHADSFFNKAEQKINKAAKTNNIEIHISNPTRFCEPNLDWRKAMKICIQRLVQCDGIALLKGWQNSKGAKIELQLAQELNIPVVYIELNDDLDYITELFEAAPESLRYFNARLTQFHNEGVEQSLAENRAIVELTNRYLDPYGFEYIEISREE